MTYQVNVVVGNEAASSGPLPWTGLLLSDDTATYLQGKFVGSEPWAFILGGLLQSVYTDEIPHDGSIVSEVLNFYTVAGHILIGQNIAWVLTPA